MNVAAGFGWGAMLALAAITVAAAPVSAADAPRAVRWITLGTNGGPLATPDRSEPANALRVGDDVYLVDAGDGAVEQLAKAGIRLPAVKAVFLSHLHFDHTAGLFALLGLRWQTNVDAPLIIYGPPGTRQMVDGLLAAMRPTTESGYGMPSETDRPADAGISVVEMGDGSSITVGSMTVRAARNTHYSFAPGSAQDARFKSLAFRFDLPGRAIAYTGDTGPSPAVAKLASGADLLVTEMIDVDRTMADVRRVSPGMPAPALAQVEGHLRAHHLTPGDVGDLAAAAQVKAVAITHFVAPHADATVQASYLDAIRAKFPGKVTIASDLQEF